MEVEYTIEEVPGRWQRLGEACYQLREGKRRRLVAYVFWPGQGFPRCKTCESSRCEHIAAVRAWRKVQKTQQAS